MVLIPSSTEDMEAMGFAIDEAPSSLSEGAKVRERCHSTERPVTLC
jgi:hypothetical protein